MINPLIKHINHPIDPSHPPAPADIAVVLIASESLRGHIPREAAEMAPWRHRWHCADRHRPPRKTRDDFTEKETTLVSYYKSIVDDLNRHMFDLSICVHKTKTHTHLQYMFWNKSWEHYVKTKKHIGLLYPMHSTGMTKPNLSRRCWNPRVRQRDPGDPGDA